MQRKNLAIFDLTKAELFLAVSYKYFRSYGEACDFFGISPRSALNYSWSDELERKLLMLLGPHGDTLFAARQSGSMMMGRSVDETDLGSEEMRAWADKWVDVRNKYFPVREFNTDSWKSFRDFFGIPHETVWWRTKTPEFEAKLDALLGPYGDAMFKAMQAVKGDK